MDIVQNFETNLQKQTQCYRQIKQLEKEKQQALVDNKVQEIEIITAQEERILLEVSHLEEERLHWAEFFGKEIAKKAEEITLADLQAHYPSLQTVIREFEIEVSQLKELHVINTKLLENAVNLVNFTLQSLTDERQNTYSNPVEKTGNQPKTKKISLIDKSV